MLLVGLPDIVVDEVADRSLWLCTTIRIDAERQVCLCSAAVLLRVLGDVLLVDLAVFRRPEIRVTATTKIATSM